MKRDLEMTVKFEDADTFEHLHSVWCGDGDIQLNRWIDDKRSERAIVLSWAEWDALVREVEGYRQLQSKSAA